ncbi:MAG TPA: hypothetical protein VIX20_00715 [Ktedonobacteraceae bacterium]
MSRASRLLPTTPRVCYGEEWFSLLAIFCVIINVMGLATMQLVDQMV